MCFCAKIFRVQSSIFWNAISIYLIALSTTINFQSFWNLMINSLSSLNALQWTILKQFIWGIKNKLLVQTFEFIYFFFFWREDEWEAFKINSYKTDFFLLKIYCTHEIKIIKCKIYVSYPKLVVDITNFFNSCLIKRVLVFA